MADTSTYRGTPRWVKVFGLILLVVVLLVAIVKLTGFGGEHGPGRHMRPDDAPAHTPPGNGHG